MRVLVTGHNGYIGAVMTPFLRAAGHEIVGLDTYFYESCTLPITEDNHVPSLRKDIRDVTPADLEGFDAVAHLAALCNDPLGDMNPELTHEINYHASVRLGEAAKKAGVERFIYASSCSLYGAASADEILTEDAPFNPLTPYALSKIRTEQAVSQLADESFSPVFMRNATAYGLSPRLRADIVLNNLVCWAHTTGRVRIMSDGSPWRPIVHIEDISRAFAAALTAPREAIHNQAFNVGVNDENYQVRQIAEFVRETVPGCQIEYAGQTGPDPRNYRVDFSKITHTLPEFQPQWDARRGARELHEAFQRVGLTQEDFQGRKFTRLKQLSHLLDLGLLDESLRWKDSNRSL
jgi:nucleoside-diphosphate-sugar epimerase